jgi:small subunit ribosomal protein S20
MARHKSAEKRVRQISKRTSVNRSRISRVRVFLKKVESAINSSDQEAAIAALREAQPEVHRGVTKGVLHSNTASRKLSRLSRRIKSISIVS